MTHPEQMALMKKLQAKFPRWTLHMLNGYVHGVADEDRFPSPRKADDLPEAAGYRGAYIKGFCDARGEDMIGTDAGEACGLTLDTLEYRWWMA